MPNITFNRTTTLSFPGSQIADITSGIVNGSLAVREILCADRITFGDINANQFQCQLYDCPNLLGKKIQVKQTDNGTVKTVFTGWVTSCKTDDLTGFKSIEAYDYFYKARKKKIKKWWNDFWSNRTQSTIGVMWKSMLDYYSIDYDSTETLLFDDLTVTKKSTRSFKKGYMTTFLNQLGEISLCVPQMSRSGSLEFKKFTGISTSNAIDIRGYYTISQSKFEEETVVPYNKVELYDENNNSVETTGTGENVFSIQNNSFLFKRSTDELQDIANYLLTHMYTFSYIPANITMKVSNLDIKAGDLVQTEKGYCFVCENNYSGSLLVNQTLVSNYEDIPNVEQGVHGNTISRNTDRTDFVVEDVKVDVDQVMADTETHLQTLDDGEVVIRHRTENPTSQKSVQFDCCSYNWLVDDEPRYATGTVNFTCSRNFLLVYYADPVGTRTFTIGSKTYTSINYTALIRLGEGETYPDDFIQFTHTGGRTDIICCDIEITEDNKVRWSPCGGQTAGEPGYYYATNWSSGTALSVEDTGIFDVHFTDVYEMWAMCRDGKVLIPNVQNGDTVLPTAQSAENLNTSLDNLANKINGQTNTQSPTFLDPDTNTLSENQYKNTGKALEKIYNNLTGKVSTITNNGRGEVVATVHHYQDDNGNPADIYIRANRNIFEQNSDGNTPSTPEEGDWYAQICFESGIYSDMDYVRDYTWSMHSTQWGIRTPNYYLRTLSNNSYYKLIGLGSDYDEGQSNQCGCELEFRNLPTDRQVSLDISVVFYRLETEHSNVPLSYHDEPLGVCFYSGSKPSSLPHTKTGAWHSDTNYQEFNTDSANDGGTVFTYTCTFTPNQSTMYAWLELSGLVLNDGVNTTKKIEFTIKPHGEELVAKKLSFCGLGGKWYDVPMSGGGGDANIDEMTVSQYNALTPAQKEDGTVRFVYDAPATEVAETVLGTSFEYADLSSVNATELQCVVSQNNVIFAGFKFDLTTRVSTALTADELTSVATLLEMQVSTNATYNITQDNDTPSCTWSNWDWYNTSTMYLDATDMSNVGVRNSYYEFSTSLIYKTAGSDNNNIYLNNRDYSGSGGTSDVELIEKTQAEYDQLTPEEKADPNVIYFITDAGGSGGGGGTTVIANPTGQATDTLNKLQVGSVIYGVSGGSSQERYSTTEQVVGTWIDGKPVYQTTYEVNLVQSGKSWVNTGIVISDIKSIISVTVNGIDRTSGMNNCPASTTALLNRYNNSNLQVYIPEQWYLTIQNITVRYTKTTD